MRTLPATWSPLDAATHDEGAFDYNASSNHVLKRKRLSKPIKKTLLDIERGQWQKYPRYGGKAAFFLNIHQSLLSGANHIVKNLESLLDLPEKKVARAYHDSVLTKIARDVISFAHHHHQIEDYHYFPAFERMIPQMADAMSLLDKDHRALEKSLENVEKLVLKLSQGRATRQAISQTLKEAKMLDKLLTRHLYDEEEIIIPIFLLKY